MVSRNRTVEQAGAIVVRKRQGNEPKVLLITAKRNDSHWLFPKGHVEDGESPEETALREAEEEAGVNATVVSEAGILTFDYGGETVRVHYFLAVTEEKGRPEKGRQLEWCTFEEAVAQLSFADTRTLLRQIWPTVVRSISA